MEKIIGIAEVPVLENGPENREALFMALYQKVFPSVAKYVSRMGGSFEEAKDVFQDALVIYYEKTVVLSNPIKYDEKGYIMGIAKNLWARKYRESSLKGSFDEGVAKSLLHEDGLPGWPSLKIVSYLEKAGGKCMEILRAFYYDKLSMGQIAEKFHYTSVRSATVQKYKCLEKVRDKIKEKSLTYEDFTE